MIHDALGGYQPEFLIGIGLSLLAGFLIGAERESRGKPAGISTHCFVVAGTMMFTYISAQVDPKNSSSSCIRDWIFRCRDNIEK
jgi:putative Mg2+ transporter-C (MgtC) family protein